MSAHSSVLGGSTAARTLACPSWSSLARQAPEPPESPYAAEGTMLHEAVAQILDDDLNPESLIGFEHSGATLTPELFNEKLLPNLQAFDEYAIEHEMKFHVEQRVDFPYVGGSFGTADIVGWNKDGVLHILDWKFGSGVPVSPQQNVQLAFYAACVYGEDLDGFTEANDEDVVLGIIQGGEIQVSWEKASWVRLIARELRGAVKAAAQAHQPIYKMGSHCRFCPAMAICPEQQDMGRNALAQVIGNMDLEQLAFWLDNADALTKFVAAVRATAHTIMEETGEIPGYKLVPKRPSRVWNDSAEAETFIRKIVKRKNNTLRISQCLKTPELLSPPQVEKQFKAEGVDPKLLTEYYSSVSTGTTVVPDTDKREAVLPSTGLARLADKFG